MSSDVHGPNPNIAARGTDDVDAFKKMNRIGHARPPDNKHDCLLDTKAAEADFGEASNLGAGQLRAAAAPLACS